MHETAPLPVFDVAIPRLPLLQRLPCIIHQEFMQAHEQHVEIELSVIPRTQHSSPPLALGRQTVLRVPRIIRSLVLPAFSGI